MERRSFLSFAGAAPFAGLLSRISRSAERIQDVFRMKKSHFWKDDYFHQYSVKTESVVKGEIKARIGGKWETFKLRELDDGFFNWNIEDRQEKLKTMKTGTMPGWSGSHNAAVATYGWNRGDSRFSLNNAIKGTGLCPKAERIDMMIEKLKETQDLPHSEKFKTFEWMYATPDLWDRRKLVSLELYATPDFETHTFLNQMQNPVSSVVFLDIPSYELRTIAQLLHPKDPGMTDHEKKIVTYINAIHTYMHSHFKAVVPAVVYHIIEEFNNSPSGKADKDKRGLRVV